MITLVGSENVPGTSGMLQHSQIHYSVNSVVKMHKIPQVVKTETLRLSTQKTGIEGWAQKGEDNMGVKES